MNNNDKFPDRRDTQYSSDHHKKTRSITFRLASFTIDGLQQEANQKEISLNVLVNQVLKRY
jgi:predicted DNA binding CopG/RHH family protein